MVFDSWIVVASIKLACVVGSVPVKGVAPSVSVSVCCGVIFSLFMVLCFVSV